MQALSIKQPWGKLIVEGLKDIENRDWPTRFRGKVLIHTGKKPDGDCFIESGLLDNPLIWLPNFPKQPNIPTDKLPRRDSDFPLGGIIGIAEIIDCISKSNSPWFVGKYGFVLANAKPLPFVPFRGQLGFFNVPDEIIKGL